MWNETQRQSERQRKTTKIYTDTIHKDKHKRHSDRQWNNSTWRKCYVVNEPQHSYRQENNSTWRQYYVVRDIYKDITE